MHAQTTIMIASRRRRFAMSRRSMNPRNLTDASDAKFLKSRRWRFARSFRSMNPTNFGDTFNVKFLKRRDAIRQTSMLFWRVILGGLFSPEAVKRGDHGRCNHPLFESSTGLADFSGFSEFAAHANFTWANSFKTRGPIQE